MFLLELGGNLEYTLSHSECCFKIKDITKNILEYFRFFHAANISITSSKVFRICSQKILYR